MLTKYILFQIKRIRLKSNKLFKQSKNPILCINDINRKKIPLCILVPVMYPLIRKIHLTVLIKTIISFLSILLYFYLLNILNCYMFHLFSKYIFLKKKKYFF